MLCLSAVFKVEMLLEKTLPVPSLCDVSVCSQAESKGRSDSARQDLALCFAIKNRYSSFGKSHF